VAIARARVRDGDFRVGTLEALPYAASTFEAIIAANVLEHTADPRAVVSELRRVCRPGGRVVVSAWGRQDECAQHAIAVAVERSLATALPRGAQDVPWGTLAAPGALERLISAAGLIVIGSATVECPSEYGDLETAWRAHAATISLSPACPRVGVARLKRAVLAALAPYRTAADSVRLANNFRYVIATPPADDCSMA
jgi:SAM-dependent methyltransferase